MKCISCGICTKNCEFLKKYNMDFSNENRMEELAFHCMLCNICTEVCPMGVDGRSQILEARRKTVEENSGKLLGYTGIQLEKENYIFKNYKKSKRSVLFPGCNYPSIYPKTTKKLVDLMKSHEVGVVFDCCGKPISELGLKQEAEKIILEINKRFEREGIEEIIILCPNCLYFLEGKLEVQITSIYKKLQEIGAKSLGGNREVLHVFPPCPDRKEQRILKEINELLPTEYKLVQGVQCCGLGGVAPAKEVEFPSMMSQKLLQYKEKFNIDDVYVYCASCAGSFERNEVNGVHHVLNEILNSKERPDMNRTLLNRIKAKFL